MSYYRRAADINVEIKKESRTDTRTPHGSGLKPAEGKGLVRLFINLGQMENFNSQKLKSYLQETANVADLHVSNIEVTRCNSYFEVGAQFVEILIAKFKKEKFRNRRVQIDYAERPTRSNFSQRGYKGRKRSVETFFFDKRNKRHAR